MVKAHVIKLNPTKSQLTLLVKSCGVARFAYNWALAKWQEDYKNEIKQNSNSLLKELTKIKREQFPWMMEVSKTCPQYAIHNVEKAYKSMWKGLTKYPKFKKKGVKDSFISVENKEQFKQRDFKIWLPRIGWVKCWENLRFEGKVNNVVVKRIADMWFACINIEVNSIEMPAVRENQATVGVDMGIKSMIVLSDGTVFENPKALRSNLKRLKQRQRRLRKKLKGSNNKKKQQMKVARLHYRISCIRKNAIHHATAAIVDSYSKIVIETLRPSNMVKNRKISRAVSDVSFGEIARQLAYKCAWNDIALVKADRWFASSKICSLCGHKKENLSLSERIYKCENCNLKMDRDLNAAKNLAKYGSTSKYEESYASGFGSSPVVMQDSPKMNEELSNLLTNKI